MAVDTETVIQQFLESARALQAVSSLTAEVVLQRVIQMYRDVRIEGAKIDFDGNMLLLQWGAANPLASDKPIDLRNASDNDISFEKTEQKFLDITRQIFAVGDDEVEDFDESAIQLSMTLFYGPALDDDPSSHKWIEEPNGIERGIKAFKSVPFVQQLLDIKASRLVATVDFCG
jgi:hypothetical protein